MITESAVWHRGILYKGKRHHDCIRSAVEATGIKPVIGDQGFITDEGLYLNRYEAAQHAIACGQIVAGKAKIRHEFDGKCLYSEDLW